MKILSVYNSYFLDFRANFLHFARLVGIQAADVDFLRSKMGISEFGSTNFREITLEKIGYIHAELAKGNDVVFFDTDIVLLKNPIPSFVEKLKDFDIVFQDDQNSFEVNDQSQRIVNTGVMAIKSNEKTLQLFDPKSKHAQELGLHENDQHLLNKRIHEIPINYHILVAEEYPCGKVWYSKPSFDPVLVHYNWIAGKKNKIKKMRSYDHWEVSSLLTGYSWFLGKLKSLRAKIIGR